MFQSQKLGLEYRYSDGVVKAGADLAASLTSRVEDTTVTYLVTATREIATTNHDLDWSPTGLAYLKEHENDPRAVLKVLGTHVVTGVRHGGAVFLVYRAECSDAESAQRVKAAVNAACLGNSGNINFEQVVRRVDQRARVDVNATSIGCPPGAPGLAPLLANPPMDLGLARQTIARAFAGIQTGVLIRVLTKELDRLPGSVAFKAVSNAWAGLQQNRKAIESLQVDYLVRIALLERELLHGPTYLAAVHRLGDRAKVQEVEQRLELVKKEVLRLLTALDNFDKNTRTLPAWASCEYGKFFTDIFIEPKGWHDAIQVIPNDEKVLFNNSPLVNIPHPELIRSVRFLIREANGIEKVIEPVNLKRGTLTPEEVIALATDKAAAWKYTPRLQETALVNAPNSVAQRWVKARRWYHLYDTEYTWEVTDLLGRTYRIAHPNAPKSAGWVRPVGHQRDELFNDALMKRGLPPTTWEIPPWEQTVQPVLFNR